MTLIYYLVILIRIIKMTEESDENGKDKSKKLENKKIPSDFITSATASSPNQKTIHGIVPLVIHVFLQTMNLKIIVVKVDNYIFVGYFP